MHKDTLKYLEELKKNNNKIWFDTNREHYQAQRIEWIEFTEKILAILSLIDPMFRDQDPRKCIFRINRDVRFSRDKSPYKTNFGAHFVPGGKMSQNAGYYLHLEPGNCFIAGGVYSPKSPELGKIRDSIAQKHKAFNKIITKKELTETFGPIRNIRLKNPPRGFKKEDPALDLLKLKSHIFILNVKDDFYDQKNALVLIEKYFTQLKPVVDFINQALKD